jgi:predicted acylesterase/phospholipase RssA
MPRVLDPFQFVMIALAGCIRGNGVYGLIKELIDSDIVVDIISGTSAGGVNGIMLAYALANGREFSASADLWREQGDIQQLLRAENDPTATSILNSRYYQQKLEKCLRSLCSQRLNNVDSGCPRGGYHRRNHGRKQQDESRAGDRQHARHFQIS